MTALAGGCVDEPVSPDAEAFEPTNAVVEGAPAVWGRSITELPPLEGDASAEPTGVNRHGIVVGVSGSRAVMWTDGVPSELETLSDAESTFANSISDGGRVALTVRLADGTRLALWEDGTVTEVPMPPGALAIRGSVNDDGQVVGTAVYDVGSRGFVWDDGELTELAPAENDEIATAYAGNGSGLVVGYTSNIYEEPDDPRDERRFVAWRNGELAWIHNGSGPWPVPDGNEVWAGGAVTDDGVAYIVNTDVGALWRWADGELSPWPFESAWEAHGVAVSPNGRFVVGLVFDLDGRSGTWGVWRDGEFFAIDLERLPISRCFDISDAAHVLCLDPEREPFVATLDFGDGGGEVPATIGGIIEYFSEAVTSGELVGTGEGASGDGRLDALLAMLEASREMIESGEDAEELCGHLNEILHRTDGEAPPPDFVDGPAAPTLAALVSTLMDERGCSPTGDVR